MILTLIRTPILTLSNSLPYPYFAPTLTPNLGPNPYPNPNSIPDPDPEPNPNSVGLANLFNLD